MFSKYAADSQIAFVILFYFIFIVQRKCKFSTPHPTYIK